ncbi:MAG: MBL fold metallo-hydrolase, partial [bacterium]|nr:MBL fold metallo-hydrolase [bacterium]
MKKTVSVKWFICLVCASVHVRAAVPNRFGESCLADRVRVLTHAPWAETMTVVDADTCLVVVDTWGSLPAARQAASRIDSLYRKPVRFVINTHHHWDHAFGNAAFPDAGIVGHRFCGPDMLEDYGCLLYTSDA